MNLNIETHPSRREITSLSFIFKTTKSFNCVVYPGKGYVIERKGSKHSMGIYISESRTVHLNGMDRFTPDEWWELKEELKFGHEYINKVARNREYRDSDDKFVCLCPKYLNECSIYENLNHDLFLYIGVANYVKWKRKSDSRYLLFRLPKDYDMGRLRFQNDMCNLKIEDDEFGCLLFRSGIRVIGATRCVWSPPSRFNKLQVGDNHSVYEWQFLKNNQED